MRKLLLFLILQFSFHTLNSFAQTHQSGGQAYGWYVIDPVSISGTPDFADVFFTDADTGWISSSSEANIFKTTNGAQSFNSYSTPLGATHAVQMLNDATNGYSGGDGGWVYKTTDGGENWNILASMGTLTDLSFPPNTLPSNPIGYACGNNGQVWKITSTLENLNTGLGGDFSGISAPSVDNVWICGGNRIYYYNGTDFTSQIAPGGTFNDIHFINNQEGWVVGDGGVIGHTTNGGTDWVDQTNPDTENRALIRVFFLDTDNGWAVGNGGIILHTIDGGGSWTIEGAGLGLTTAFLKGVHFTSTTNGYVVGNEKTLIKFGEITSVENEEELPTEFSLIQNYPNPFNPSTKINYKLAKTGFTSLKVYDVLGNEVANLISEEKPAGQYEVEFNGNGLTSGIYFYQLKAGNYIETKKMILIK